MSVIAPPGVMRPTPQFVWHRRLPSGPAMIELGHSPSVVHFERVTKGNSVMLPDGVMRLILFPSCPFVIPAGRLLIVGMGYSLIAGAAYAADRGIASYTRSVISRSSAVMRRGSERRYVYRRGGEWEPHRER